ncbi:unnamed protein product [Clonostachys rhizophaga]|uniref:Zn(2)-C6 fungal-type domain-containing protein n=1 Tax=Clonostachys rhizophaga TaxID=160324 RepID=A0A9N9VUT8_9HYPO|nr:unnamed protein product [Clonostachys rhizophaga]
MESHHHSPHHNDRVGWHMLPHEFVNDTFFDHKPAWQCRLDKDHLAPPDSSSELTRNGSIRSTASLDSCDSGYSTIPPLSPVGDLNQPPWTLDLLLEDDEHSEQLRATSPAFDSCSVTTEVAPGHMEKPRLERRPHTKIRRGCANCKMRHVKASCQETQPSCENCVKRGVKCEYPSLPRIVRQESGLSSLVAPTECSEPGSSFTVASAQSLDSGIEINDLVGEWESFVQDHFPEDCPEPGGVNNNFRWSVTSRSPERPLDHHAENEQHDQEIHESSINIQVEASEEPTLPPPVPDHPETTAFDSRLPDTDAYVESTQELHSIMAAVDPCSSGESSLVSTRVPSPWQEAANLVMSEQHRINEHLSRSLEWILSRNEDDDESAPESNPESLPSSAPDVPSSLPPLSELSADSRKKRVLDAFNVHVPDDHSQNSKRRKTAVCPTNDFAVDESAPSDDPGSSSSHQDSSQSSINRTSARRNTGASRTRRTSNEGPGRSDEDEANNRPPPPGQPISPPYDSLRQSKRPRYACPYNKWDPIGCQLCCMPSRKNPEGGAEGFSRVKSHIFRNHDITVRCQKCWASFPTKSETLDDHVRKNGCMRKASPTKYWMTEDQRRQVRGQRFVSGGEENWYHLFRILLPEAQLQDELGSYLFTPYYVPLSGSRTPSNLSGPASQVAGIPLPMSGMQTPSGHGFNNASLSHLPNMLPMGDLPAVLDDTWSQIPAYMYDADVAVIDDPHIPPPSQPNEDVSTSSIDLYPTPRTRRHSDESGESGSGHVFGHHSRTSSGNESRRPAVQTPPQDASSAFLRLDNERLRRSVTQVRGERDDMRRRMEAANGRIDCLDQLLEEALYEEGKSSKLCSKLFELSKMLVDLRKELG